MHVKTHKAGEGENRTVNAALQKRDDSRFAVPHSQRESSNAAAQLKLLELANNNPRVNQLKAFQALADDRSRVAAQRERQGRVAPCAAEGVAQCAVVSVGNGVQARWRSTLISERSFATRAEAEAAESDLYARTAAMTPLPLAFGSGAPYGFHGFPELGSLPRADVPRVTEQVQSLAPMLHTVSPQNRRFNTSEPPRPPTMYFQEHGLNLEGQPAMSSGRVRQEHDDGPVVYVDRHPRNHLFSHDERMLGIENEYDLEDDDIDTVGLGQAEEGMHHIEVHHNDPRHRSWELAHSSGGTLSTAPMNPHDVDRAILRSALRGRVDDRRRTGR
ncbi:hypothetical protein CR152_23520 [Massilia violaceinigra]|uniref:Uncharacterized protein n=1 Tax=Massilia violaceinigra TaxID=2045208 RepID=A0A2D2DQD5_9BURK|nr:hypothetical protein [Massilia violaceinigra]ATQ77153.1 hypothetical protein CR152_23520 [Massilia violaceinigra]